jgi:NADPH-dependent glutamate synthase beta subunit-like oxidoreductase
MQPVPTIWTTGTTEVFKTGTWRAALPRHIRAPSPCHAACPVGGDIAEWIGRARARDLRGAWEILTRHNPFPAIAGRVCHHPCEAACNRGGYDEPLAIRALERCVGDSALERGWTFAPPVRERAERVAIVGGGPSGLSAAFQLRRRGYAVTLFEASRALGGLMRYGIPAYRLARSVLDAEIARIVALGVDVRCEHPLDTPQALAQLRREYDAVYVAVGARRQKRLPQLDYTQPWVLDGAQYLAAANAGAPAPLGARVVVVGGGSAAFDAARSARRAGHQVTLLALERAEELPANREEVLEALEEGIALECGAMLTAARWEDAAHLQCTRVVFARGARRGEFTVAPIPGTAFALTADAVITSIGQEPDLAPLTELESDGALVKTDARQATSVPRVYAGGDVASLARFVTEAVGMGKRAALEIDRVLRGADESEARDEAVVPLAAIATFYHPRQPRTAEPRLEVAQRLRGNAEVQLALQLDAALAEAARCFSCGTCIGCDNCVVYCPDLAVQRAGRGYTVLTDYCKGCGLCVRECPTGSMQMVEEVR